MEKVLTCPPVSAPLSLAMTKEASSADLGEMLRLSLDGRLPAGGLLSHWFDRLEGWK